MTFCFLSNQPHPCGYYSNKPAETEHFLLKESEPAGVQFLLEKGFRHFGAYFFRPRCKHCGSCVPMRVCLTPDAFTANRRRKLSKASFLNFSIEDKPLTHTHYKLYLNHKKRFSSDNQIESFESFDQSFASLFPFQKRLEIRLGKQLIGVCHFDDCGSILSAVYTYYSLDFMELGLGTLAVLWLIREGINCGYQHLYLGYYIQGHPHMGYKGRYKPFEVLSSDGNWTIFSDNQSCTYHPAMELKTELANSVK